MLNKHYKTIVQDNGKIEIYGNNQWRQFLYFYELTDKEKQELDYIDNDTEPVFRYKSNVYSLSDFMNIHNKIYNPNPLDWMLEFDGYTNDSYFSGIRINLNPDDSDFYKVYTYIS